MFSEESTTWEETKLERQLANSQKLSPALESSSELLGRGRRVDVAGVFKN